MIYAYDVCDPDDPTIGLLREGMGTILGILRSHKSVAEAFPFSEFVLLTTTQQKPRFSTFQSAFYRDSFPALNLTRPLLGLAFTFSPSTPGWSLLLEPNWCVGTLLVYTYDELLYRLPERQENPFWEAYWMILN